MKTIIRITIREAAPRKPRHNKSLAVIDLVPICRPPRGLVCPPTTLVIKAGLLTPQGMSFPEHIYFNPARRVRANPFLLLRAALLCLFPHP